MIQTIIFFSLFPLLFLIIGGIAFYFHITTNLFSKHMKLILKNWEYISYLPNKSLITQGSRRIITFHVKHFIFELVTSDASMNNFVWNVYFLDQGNKKLAMKDGGKQCSETMYQEIVAIVQNIKYNLNTGSSVPLTKEV